MSKTGPKRFVLISAAVMFAMIISVNSAGLLGTPINTFRSRRSFRISPHRAKKSNIQPNRPHQRQPIALRNNAFSELVIEEHPSILEFFLEMDIVQLPL